jgi:pheromone shutdown-related protein TraB
MSWWKKNTLVAALLGGIFSRETLSEDDLRGLRKRDVLSEMIRELARELPVLKQVLIDERDAWLAQKIRTGAGSRIVAVVGAGHLEGIERALAAPAPEDLSRLESIPAVLPVMKVAGWLVPVSILAGLAVLAWTRGAEVAGQSLRFWILITGIPSALGATLAAGHPATIAAGFLAAPITSLSPLVGVGYVTALVQAYFRPPRVRDFQHVSEEMAGFSTWWRNRLLRVFLAFVLPTLGTIVGVYVGGARILRELI